MRMRRGADRLTPSGRRAESAESTHSPRVRLPLPPGCSSARKVKALCLGRLVGNKRQWSGRRSQKGRVTPPQQLPKVCARSILNSSTAPSHKAAGYTRTLTPSPGVSVFFCVGLSLKSGGALPRDGPPGSEVPLRASRPLRHDQSLLLRRLSPGLLGSPAPAQRLPASPYPTLPLHPQAPGAIL